VLPVVDFRVLVSHPLDRVMPFAILATTGLLCVATEHRAAIVALAVFYVATNLTLSRVIQRRRGRHSVESLEAWCRILLSLPMSVMVAVVTDVPMGWLVTVPSVAVLPFVFGRCWKLGQLMVLPSATATAAFWVDPSVLHLLVTATTVFG